MSRCSPVRCSVTGGPELCEGLDNAGRLIRFLRLVLCSNGAGKPKRGHCHVSRWLEQEKLVCFTHGKKSLSSVFAFVSQQMRNQVQSVL